MVAHRLVGRIRRNGREELEGAEPTTEQMYGQVYGAVLGISASGVRSRLDRLLDRLRAELEHE